MDKKKYVVGFAFSHDYTRVVLIRKNKPEWQAGYLNGVGGKIEDGEDFLEAMIREFKEEAGILIPRWKRFARLEFPDAKITFLKCKIHSLMERQIRSTTDEKIEIHDIVMLNTLKTIPNLQWLIPMALRDLPDTYYKIKQQ